MWNSCQLNSVDIYLKITREFTRFNSREEMAPKKGKKKKSGKKRKSAKGPAIIDGISTEEMSKEQLEQHIHRLREGRDLFLS